MDSYIHSLSAKGVKTNQLVFIGVGEANAGREGIVTKVYLNKDIVDVRLFETEGEITSYDKNKIIPITNKPVISKKEFTFDAKGKSINVNNMANFEFWVGMYKPRTKTWQRQHLRELKKGFKAFGESDGEHQDKIKAMEFVLGDK